MLEHAHIMPSRFQTRWGHQNVLACLRPHKKTSGSVALAFSFAITAIIICGFPTYVRAEHSRGVLELQRLSRVLESDEIPDEAKLEQIAKDLDDISTDSQTGLQARDTATLVRLAAQIPYSLDSAEGTNRLQRRREAMVATLSHQRKPDTNLGTKAGRELLVISAGMLGLEIDQGKLIEVLDNTQVAPEIRLVAAEALLRQPKITPNAMPALKKMSRDPWSYIDSSDVGPPNPSKIYPLRNAAYEGLLRLGVKCRKITREEVVIDPNWGIKFFETIVEITE
jgi:hypothetical protein